MYNNIQNHRIRYVDSEEKGSFAVVCLCFLIFKKINGVLAFFHG